MSREQTKAANYIQQLDAARCEGNWDAVPELLRKIRKHAAARSCLILTAEAEYAATKASLGRPSTARPSTAKSSITTSPEASGLAKYIPKLLDAIEKERTYVEDEFQAQVCLGWIHWKLGEPALAAGRLPKSIEQEFALLDGTNKESAEWTRVCALKGSYIKGDSQCKTGNVADALETFESGLPIFATVSSSQKQGKELLIWTELFLTGFCMLSSNAIKTKVTSFLETRTLSAFRAWAKFWETQGSTIKGGHAPQAEVSRRRVWREYYIVLSNILQRELPFPTTDLTVTHPQTSTRLLQRAEMKRVEASYEALLLSEIQFPRAEEFNEEVEIFVELVMQNWRVICGSTWTEQDLGEGGSEAISRGVLDILYRAATKTFHSTAILRDLFTVHLAVAEFEIAIKAFDTYMEIVNKGKSRVDKTGEPEPALDDDETVLVTGAECIKALCRYGSRSGAEKAKDIGHFFEDWLEKHHPIAETNGIERAIENGKPNSIATTIRPQAFALAWRSIGIAHAQWARLTFEASSRSDIQLKAIKCFRNSLLPQFENTTSPETRFALGTILAERRELAAAIEVVKAGLLPHSTVESSGLGPHPGRFARERTLIPLWHLMALLLSARQEFVTAARSCEGAFEQFQEPKYLFGEADLNYRSDHLNEKSHPRSLGVIDYMDDFEKRNVLEVKMTQLALIEVLEGPEVAVNASDELLSLYARLFGDPQRDASPPAVQHNALRPPPKSSAGTLKSIKGSIFGRPNRSMKRPTTSSMEEKPLTLLRPNTTQTIASPPAPSIQVTNENGGTAKQHHHLTKQHPPASGQTRSQSLTRRKSSGTARTRSTSAGRKISVNTSQAPTTVDGEEFFTPPDDSQDRTQWIDGQRPPQVGVAVSPSNDSTQSSSRPLPPKSQQMPQKEKSLKPASSDLAKTQDNRLPSLPHISVTDPVTRFSKDQQRRRRVCILVKVWLQIAGFYRRGAMYEDANGAIQEAYKLVQSVDAEISKLTTPDISVSNPGWGAGKSVKELWGDVFAERGSLAVAEKLPYIALGHFESALTSFVDHPAAIVGLSNILLDIYNEDLLPPPSIPQLEVPILLATPSASNIAAPGATTPPANEPLPTRPSTQLAEPHGPLGLSFAPLKSGFQPTEAPHSSLTPSVNDEDASTALLDRLAARDRAYGLLSTLTKLGTGWNYSEAWFALARAHELSGQLEKSRESLWWCVELEEGRAVRDWDVVVGGSGEAGSGYVL